MTLLEELTNAQMKLWDGEDELYTTVDKFVSEQDYGNLTWDYYDSSLELKSAQTHVRVSKELAVALQQLGFHRVWVCYTDGSERAYVFDPPYCGFKQRAGTNPQKEEW